MHPSKYITGIIDRLIKYRSIDPITGCWIWTGSPTTTGYGVIKLKNRRNYKVTRIIAWLCLGLNLYNTKCLVLHKQSCNNKKCFNPTHLYLGDAKDNMRDCGELNGLGNQSELGMHLNHSRYLVLK